MSIRRKPCLVHPDDCLVMLLHGPWNPDDLGFWLQSTFRQSSNMIKHVEEISSCSDGRGKDLLLRFFSGSKEASSDKVDVTNTAASGNTESIL